jgi:hypothetical protein
MPSTVSILTPTRDGNRTDTLAKHAGVCCNPTCVGIVLTIGNLNHHLRFKRNNGTM